MTAMPTGRLAEPAGELIVTSELPARQFPDPAPVPGLALPIGPVSVAAWDLIANRAPAGEDRDQFVVRQLPILAALAMDVATIDSNESSATVYAATAGREADGTPVDVLFVRDPDAAQLLVLLDWEG